MEKLPALALPNAALDAIARYLPPDDWKRLRLASRQLCRIVDADRVEKIKMAPPGDTEGMPVPRLLAVAARFPSAWAIDFVCRRGYQDTHLLTAFLASLPDGVCPGIEYLNFDCGTPLAPSHVMNLLQVFPALETLRLCITSEKRGIRRIQQEDAPEQQGQGVGLPPPPPQPQQQQQRQQRQQRRPAPPGAAASLRGLHLQTALCRERPTVAALLRPLTGLHFLEAKLDTTGGWDALSNALPSLTALAGLTAWYRGYGEPALALLPLAGLQHLRELDLQVPSKVFERHMREGGPLAHVTKLGVCLSRTHAWDNKTVSTADLAAGLPSLRALAARDVDLGIDEHSVLPHLTELKAGFNTRRTEALARLAPALQYGG